METIVVVLCITFYMSLKYFLDYKNELQAREDYYKNEGSSEDDPDWWKRSNN